ncbi:MAG: hypothetical protein ABIQ95_06700 [Bdellovibrionia bacterium]
MRWLKKNLTWCCFFLLLAVSLFFPLQDADVFFYLSMGRLFFETGSIPYQDPYLYSFPDWYVLHEWLSYVLFYISYLIGGISGLIIMKILLWVSIFTVLARQACKSKIPEAWIFAILFLTLGASSVRFTERASLFSDVFLTVMAAYLLSPQKLSRKILWIFPLVFIFWVNIHPGFILGLVLFLAYLLLEGSKVPRWAWGSWFLSLIGCLLNPKFLEGALFPFRALTPEWSLYRSRNFEWMPTFEEPFRSTWEVRFLIVLLLLTLVLLSIALLKKGRRHSFAGVTFLIYCYLAQNASRFISTSALGFSLLSFYALRELKWELKESWNRRFTTGCAVFFLALAGWITLEGYTTAAGYRRFGGGLNPEYFPVGAANFIKSRDLQGHFFNEYAWGSYFIWTLNRKQSLFIHGHIDDPRHLADDYFAVNARKDLFDNTVNRYDIRYFVLDKAKLFVEPRPKLLDFLDQWKIIYEDEISIIWAR